MKFQKKIDRKNAKKAESAQCIFPALKYLLKHEFPLHTYCTVARIAYCTESQLQEGLLLYHRDR